MRKIKVRIENPTKLILEEDAYAGDYINIDELLKVDQSMILESIKSATDEVYANKLSDEKIKFDMQKQKEILEIKQEFSTQFSVLKEQAQEYKNTIDQLQTKIESEKENTRLSTIQIKSEEFQKKEQILNDQIRILMSDIEVLKNTQKINSDNQKLLLESQYKDVINKRDNELVVLKEKLSDLSQSKESEIKNTKLEVTQLLQKQIYEKETEISTLKNLLKETANKYDIILLENEKKLQEKISNLEKDLEIITREKASRNIKKIGEELEKWCNDQYQEVSMYGFKTSTWEKDNTAIKNHGDSKGTKGDYIFKVFTNSEHKTPLTSAMCEMKSEALESENKKANADHYKKLDEDRKKKELEYAILISELEYDANSYTPIFPVKDYDKMYVVRPAYFITLLGIIESIGLKYSELVTVQKIEEHKFKDINEILNDFEQFKNNIIDNSLRHITTNLQNIKSDSNAIIKLSENILKSTEVVVNTHLLTIKNKIENYSIKSLTKKIENIN